MIEEIHGVHRVVKVTVTSDDYQDAIVKDHGPRVRLSLTANSYPADMTPEQAEMLASALNNAAARVRAIQKASK